MRAAGRAPRVRMVRTVSDVSFRLLLASENPGFMETLRELADSARALMPVGLEIRTSSPDVSLGEEIASWGPDALMLDWSPVDTGVMEELRSVLAGNPGLRVLVLLPGSGREYREAVWGAGACACIPRDRADPEWLQAVLCVMNRAKQREEQVWAEQEARPE